MWLSTLIATLLFAAPVGATVIHGDFSGTSFDFLGVQETTQTGGDPEPLFGAPTVAGNSLGFTPTVFDSSASGAGGADTDLSLLEATIMSTGLDTIDSLVIQESGETTLGGAGTSITQTSVAMSGFITVLEVDGSFGFNTSCFIDFGGACVVPFLGVITPGVPFELPGDSGTTSWSGLVDVDLSSFAATKVQLSFNNQLDAFSELGTTADISKDSVTISVPEPGTLLLLATCLLGVRGMRRALRRDSLA